MVRRGLSLLFLVFIGFLSKAQDIHFTQFFFSPLNLNPAYTGAFDGDWRAVGNHRSQWGAVVDQQFITSGLSYDQNIDIYGHLVAAGINFVHDQSSIGVLQQNKLQLNGSYRKKIAGHTFGGGIQFGLIHKGIDYNKYTYPDQYNDDPYTGGNFDNSLANNQNFVTNNIYLFDFSLGLMWQKSLTEKITPTVGFTLFHLNTPRESFLGNDNKLPIRKVFDVSVNYQFKPRLRLIPKILFMHHTNAQELVWGGLARYLVSTNKYGLYDVFAGFSSRNGFNRTYDSFTLVVGGVVKEWQLGISYDINASELSSVSHYRGAFELSLIYIAKNTKSKVVNVPCDRL